MSDELTSRGQIEWVVSEISGLPVMYTLPFSKAFDAPIGATIEYVGMAKWLYRSPGANEVKTFFDNQPNSYARDVGGMTGSKWTVTRIEARSSDEFLVTFDPV